MTTWMTLYPTFTGLQDNKKSKIYCIRFLKFWYLFVTVASLPLTNIQVLGLLMCHSLFCASVSLSEKWMLIPRVIQDYCRSPVRYKKKVLDKLKQIEGSHLELHNLNILLAIKGSKWESFCSCHQN